MTSVLHSSSGVSGSSSEKVYPTSTPLTFVSEAVFPAALSNCRSKSAALFSACLTPSSQSRRCMRSQASTRATPRPSHFPFKSTCALAASLLSHSFSQVLMGLTISSSNWPPHTSMISFRAAGHCVLSCCLCSFNKNFWMWFTLL